MALWYFHAYISLAFELIQLSIKSRLCKSRFYFFNEVVNLQEYNIYISMVSTNFYRYMYIHIFMVQSTLHLFSSTHSHFALYLTSLCQLSLSVIVSVNAQHWKIAGIPYPVYMYVWCALSSIQKFVDKYAFVCLCVCVLNFLWHAYAFVHYLDATRDRLSAQAVRSTYPYPRKVAKVKIWKCIYIYVNMWVWVCMFQTGISTEICQLNVLLFFCNVCF